jgi:hypothetical protein
MYSLFELPSEVLVSALLGEFPCREAQIRALGALVAVSILALPVHFLALLGDGLVEDEKGKEKEKEGSSDPIGCWKT